MTALACGADAIYAGLKGWSRGGAKGELAPAELRDVLAMAHERGRRLHVALNVIPREDERRRLVREVRELIDWGIDGVIVNDAGLLAELRARYPGLSLTASVGCSAMNAADVAFYRDLGAAAVVLPGTMSPDEVGEAARVPGVRIEVMVHMVQEFVILGKCWMPSYYRVNPIPMAQAWGQGIRIIGSVKRGGAGVCYSVCEQPWGVYLNDEMVDERLLPSRQVAGVRDLAAILDAGATVVKLQGRSLSPARLAPLVRAYRAAIDGWMGATDPPPLVEFSLDPSWTVARR
jgi:putative protease